MGKRKVEHLTIGEGSRMAIYDRKQSPADLYFEETADADVFKVTLVEGTYGHDGQELNEGQFYATMSAGGSLQGYVLTSMADQTAADQPVSITLTLKAE